MPQVLAEYRAHKETEAALRFERRRRLRARAEEEQRKRNEEATAAAAAAARTGRVAALRRVKEAKETKVQAEQAYLERHKVGKAARGKRTGEGAGGAAAEMVPF